MTEGFKLKGISLENVLRFLGKSRKKLWLKISLKNGKEGNIWLKDGVVLHAVLNDLSGIQALSALLNAEYRDVMVFKDFVETISRSIDKPLDEALEDALNFSKLTSKERAKLKKGGSEMLDDILKKLKTEIPYCLGVGVFHINEGLMVGAVTDLPNYDHDVAGAAYSTMMSSIKKALSIRGEGIYVNIKDVLVETDDKYLYVRVLGNTNYAIVAAMSKEGNLGYLRAMLKKTEPELIKALP